MPSATPREPRVPGGPLARLVARHYLGKPELESLLGIKYTTRSALANAALNEVAFRLRSLRSHAIVQLNVELTNRCNLACVMCPVNRDMVRERHELDAESFRRLVDDNPDLHLMLMFQWGESLLVRDFFERLRYATDRGIRVMITTNGTLLTEKVCARILESRLERLTISVDGAPETHERIRGYSLDRLRANVERLVRMRDERGSPLGIDVNMTVWEENEADADLVRQAWGGLVDRVQLIPRFADAVRRTPCRELWRGAPIVHSNGNVVPCCRDSEGVLRIGNIHEEPLAAMFNGPRMRRLRDIHRRGRFPPICARCGEYESTRVSPRFS